MGMICKLNSIIRVIIFVHAFWIWNFDCYRWVPPNPLLVDSDEVLLYMYKNMNNYNGYGTAESIPLSSNTLKIAAQSSAVTRIKWMSHDSLCNKVKEFLTASSKKISLCDRLSKVQSDTSFLGCVKAEWQWTVMTEWQNFKGTSSWLTRS